MENDSVKSVYPALCDLALASLYCKISSPKTPSVLAITRNQLEYFSHFSLLADLIKIESEWNGLQNDFTSMVSVAKQLVP